MRRARWLAPWRNSGVKPAIYHCISRVVDRQFVFGDSEREQFRTLMRMYEKFCGIRILAYCIMSNHIHLLLEIPPVPKNGISDEELLHRLRAIYSTADVALVEKELFDARAKGLDAYVKEIHVRYAYRMHDLSQYMKTVMQRMTQWYNKQHERRGTLWEERFKSVIVESGIAARTMAAYIDLNPVRAGIVYEPAEYRWSSYGEAMGGGAKGNGKKAREGLVRACLSHKGVGFEEQKWRDVSANYRKMMSLAIERKSGAASEMVENVKAKRLAKATSESLQANRDSVSSQSQADMQELVWPELTIAGMLGLRIRYFTAGAVIGSKLFVNEVFVSSRERFGERRKDGARPLRGDAKEARGLLWSMRDLSV